MRKNWKTILGIMFILMAGGLILARLYLPVWIKDFVNNELQNLSGYTGEVQDIDVHLYRGAYTIHMLEIRKKNGHIPVPFLKIETMDLAIEWRALFNGRVVAKIKIYDPALNFAVNPGGTVKQTGEGIDWTQAVKKLMPVDINRVTLYNGKIAYRNFSTSPPINLFINGINGEATNIRNVVDKEKDLPSTLQFTGNSIGKGKLQFDGRMNILTRIPELEFALKLEKVNLPALNNYFKAFAFVDVEKGNFDFYSEITVHKGKVEGYAKPIASHISLIDLSKDANPIKLVWESLVSVVMEVFTNHRNEQFATRIPITGTVEDVKTDVWATIGGIISNAFIEALKKGPDRELKLLKPVTH